MMIGQKVLIILIIVDYYNTAALTIVRAVIQIHSNSPYCCNSNTHSQPAPTINNEQVFNNDVI